MADLYTIKQIVCDYAVVSPYEKVMCICNCKSNAEYIADILNADSSEKTAYTYNAYVNRKWDIKERKQGKWIGEEEGYYSECSCCGASFLWEDYKCIGDWKYCPNCGADMRGKNETD